MVHSTGPWANLVQIPARLKHQQIESQVLVRFSGSQKYAIRSLGASVSIPQHGIRFPFWISLKHHRGASPNTRNHMASRSLWARAGEVTGKELAELRSFRNPPAVVCQVLEARGCESSASRKERRRVAGSRFAHQGHVVCQKLHTRRPNSRLVCGERIGSRKVFGPFVKGILSVPVARFWVKGTVELSEVVPSKANGILAD